MSEECETPPKTPEGETEFSREVGRKAARKLKAQRGVNHTIWFGLGMMGLVGWSVAVPVLVGVGLGFWMPTTRWTIPGC